MIEEKDEINCKFLHGDAREIPLQKNHVDISFIHGALEIIPDGEKVINEMFRVSKRRVIAFLPDHNFIAPGEDIIDVIDEEIDCLEDELNIQKKMSDIDSRSNLLTWREVPAIFRRKEFKDVYVDGIMMIFNPNELDKDNFEKWAKAELKDRITHANNIAGSKDSCDKLLKAYKKKYGKMVKNKKKGMLNDCWYGGPMIAVIGDK